MFLFGFLDILYFRHRLFRRIGAKSRDITHSLIHLTLPLSVTVKLTLKYLLESEY